MCGGSNSTSPMLHNNGNLRTQQVFLPGPNEANYDTVGYHFFTQHYGYDSLNRLQSVDETFDDGAVNWHQNYAYDRYGNRTLDPATSGVNNTAFDKNEARFTNRIYAPGDTALPMIQRQMQYDSAGNLINDNYTGQGLHTYDAENRMTSSAGVSAGVYFYDGDGHRIKRTVGGVETWQVYGLGGELIAEYPANGSQGSPQKEYGYRNGQLLITATPATAGWGPAPPIDDNPLNPPGQPKTDVKAIHITQLRSAINALRAHYNLPNYPWQKPTASGGAINNTVYVSWEPIDEMRTALNEALGPPSTPYAGGLAAGQPILKDHIQELRDRVLASWNSGSTALDIHWMVTDQLRTPRMVFDLSGSLVATSRHDYLPFGEEIYANTGGRLMAQGYPTPQNALDSTRQKFTEKERDIETGLDYFGARYYSSVQGRFISVDPARKSIIPQNPQSWNRYTYAYNNPLALIDNNGKWPTDTHNYIIATAFNGLSPQKVRQIQEGSASVDGSFKKLVNQPIRLLTQNTLLESEAFKHAMTPGALVRQFNGDVGRAKQEATKLMNAFIDERMGAAQRTFQAGENRNGVNNAALTTFGEGAHPIMDNVSPQHAGMQVYDLAPYFKTYQKYAKWGIPEVGATLAIKDYKNDMDEHSAGEARMPTTDEMNVMVDQLRMRYLQTFGREEYERAVTADEREKTERRLKGQR
jgi:RHS repeat-associated protein